MVPSVYTLVVLLAGLLSSADAALVCQVLFTLFATTSAVELTALGGAPLTPAVLFLVFLLWRALREPGARVVWQRIPSESVWLATLALWGLLSSLLLPRLFEHAVQTYTVDRSKPELGVQLYPLHPISGNITQTAYLLGSAAAFFCTRALLRTRRRELTLSHAVLALTLLNIVAALINLAEYHAGLPPVLVYLRTASYSLFEAYEEGGLMRIQGTFSEASGFGTFTLPLFAYCLQLWMDGQRPVLSGSLALGSLGLLLISTSGTAYVGLALFGAYTLVRLMARAAHDGRFPRLVALTALGLLGTALLGALFVLETSVADAITRTLEHFVFSKVGSRSGIERAAWNAQGWSNFVSTLGLGVGLGSARTSSFAVALISNLGIPGVLCFCAFLWHVFRTNARQSAEGEAAKSAMVATLLAASLSAANVDLGILFHMWAAAASARIVSPATARLADQSGRAIAPPKRAPPRGSEEPWPALVHDGRPNRAG